MNLVMQETEPYTGRVIQRRGAATNIGICEQERENKEKVRGRDKKRCRETVSVRGEEKGSMHAPCHDINLQTSLHPWQKQISTRPLNGPVISL